MTVVTQFIAQIINENANALLTYGPLGIVCGWLMWKIERMENKLCEGLSSKLGDLSHRIEGLTRTMLVDMAERESAGERTKEYARDTIAQIDARSKIEAERGSKK
jgi:hypothetical protein